MRLFLLLALTALLTAPRAEAKMHRFEEHDLELEAPSSWLLSPPDSRTAILLHNQIAEKIGGDTSRGSKSVAVNVSTFPKGLAIDTEAIVDLQREGFRQQGAIVVKTGSERIGSLTYHTTTLAEQGADLPGSYVCTTFGNDRAVTVSLRSQVGDPTTDADLMAIIRSLHFISPYRPITELTQWMRFKAYTRRHPVAVTMMALAGIAAVAVLGLILKQSAANRRPARSARRRK